MGHNEEASFGGDLRKAREQRELSIEAISEATKVPAKYIRSLESGDLAELPGGVFRRGFVRSYVGALGLEESRWMKRFDAMCRESGIPGPVDSDWTKFAENVKNTRAAAGPSSAAKGAGLGLLLILLALAGWCGWRLMTHRRLIPVPLVGTHLKSWVDKASSR